MNVNCARGILSDMDISSASLGCTAIFLLHVFLLGLDRVGVLSELNLIQNILV